MKIQVGNLKIYWIIVSIFSGFVFSCSSNVETVPIVENIFDLTDKAGSYTLKRVSGLTKNGIFSTKSFLTDSNGKELERSFTLSEIGSYKNTRVLRPYKSYNEVWFNGKKSTSKIILNKESKGFDFHYYDAEKRKNFNKLIKAPVKVGMMCFLSQIIECSKISGFIKKAISIEAGSMNVLIVLDGHPFIGQQYPSLPRSPLVKSKLVFDGRLKDGLFRFTLNFPRSPSIFYSVSKSGNLNGMYFVTDGLSVKLVK